MPNRAFQKKIFFAYVIPSVLAFALSGVYAIVDGFFVGNSIGDLGLSAINIAYPVTALIQAVGTGIGMGGAVHYSISHAKGDEKEGKYYLAGTLWLLLLSSAALTIVLSSSGTPILRLLGASGDVFTLGREYLTVIILGAVLQIMGTGLVPILRNLGGATYATVFMILGFATNIFGDYLLVWQLDMGASGAAIATVVGQGATMTGTICFLIKKKQVHFSLPKNKTGILFKNIIQVGIAPFGVSLTPNFSLILINRFSVSYGGNAAVACYACVSYVMTIVYLLLQGVGDGSQPLMSQYYGSGNKTAQTYTQRYAYGFAMIVGLAAVALIYVLRGQVGALFGASGQVLSEVAVVLPIFLIPVPFIAISRITTASFYATEKSKYSYLLTYGEPLIMLFLLCVLPRFFGGQVMIWWSAAIAQILVCIIAIMIKRMASDDTRVKRS